MRIRRDSGYESLEEDTLLGLQQNILDEAATKLPLRELACVSPDATVADAVDQMKRKNVGCVIVIDHERRPIGKFTERRLTRMLLSDADAMSRPVREHMAEAWGCVRENESIACVIDLLKRRDLRILCVVDGYGRAVALTGQRGVMEYIASHYPHQVLTRRVSTRPDLETREGA